MLSLQIDNQELEQSLYSQFNSKEKIKEYLYELIVEDLEDKKFVKMIQDEHKKDFVSKDDVFKVLNTI
ncbi:MAG: hypothetical protein K8R39_01795 [Arcobacteraceae bacterium]|nr:hypothetical protein [Arcobacteraceae bacterium]